jgi:hypothetical protein
MKRIILLLSMILMLAALLISPETRAESLNQIMNRYNTCDSNYNYDMTHSPDQAAGDCRFGNYNPEVQCLNHPDPPSCIESYRTTCIQNATSNHLSCVSAIEQHRDMENFCDHAREIRDYCNAAYVASEDYEAWSSCMASSGIWQCE